MWEITWSAFLNYGMAYGLALVSTIVSCRLAMLWSKLFADFCCGGCGCCR